MKIQNTKWKYKYKCTSEPQLCGRQSPFQLLPYGFALDSQGGGGEVIWAMPKRKVLLVFPNIEWWWRWWRPWWWWWWWRSWRWWQVGALCEGASLALLNARPSAQPSMKLKMMILAAIMMRRIIHDCIGGHSRWPHYKVLQCTMQPSQCKVVN